MYNSSAARKAPRHKTPEAREFAPRGHSLRETDENSNYILLRIPIELSDSAHSEKAIAVAEGPLSSILPLSPDTIIRLQDVRLIHHSRPVRAKRLPIDYGALQQTSRRMLTEGGFASQTELARNLGVSRVWVSRVLKGIKREDRRLFSRPPAVERPDTSEVRILEGRFPPFGESTDSFNAVRMDH